MKSERCLNVGGETFVAVGAQNAKMRDQNTLHLLKTEMEWLQKNSCFALDMQVLLSFYRKPDISLEYTYKIDAHLKE